MRTRIFTKMTWIGCLLLSIPVIGMAQQAPILYHKEPYVMESGVHSGLKGPMAAVVSAFRDVVQAPNAPWLQLHFGEYNLGEQSYVTITSLKDGHMQRLDAKSLPEWQSSTAYFNGDAVEVELHVAAGEDDIFVRLEEVTVGDWVEGLGIESLCGPDSRVPSTDPAVGRIVPVGCTGWIVSNGAHLTAGHCNTLGPPPLLQPQMQILQFNVPASQPNGTIVNPPPQQQYPITAASIQSNANGVGDDWALFNCGRNANTRLLPVEAQGAFYRMSRDSNPATFRVTGYGTAPGTLNQTQQTATGANGGESIVAACNASFNYRVDTQGGNSGSPIIGQGTTLTVGIHTNAGCAPMGGSNSGTSFNNTCAQNAIGGFPGANARYVDANHPSVQQDGTVFRPFRAVNQAIAAVPVNGIVSIVSGAYNENITVNAAMTLTAPVGTVTITGGP